MKIKLGRYRTMVDVGQQDYRRWLQTGTHNAPWQEGFQNWRWSQLGQYCQTVYVINYCIFMGHAVA
jgi:hypothetical protein